MTLNHSIQTEALVLAPPPRGGAPDWIQLTPPGPSIEGRDGRRWKLSSPERVIAEFRLRGLDLPVDYEHATQVKGEKGEFAPAVGWVKELEARAGAIWARVEWTDAGGEALRTRSYRYASPVFDYEKKSGEIVRMVSVGLTNQPNLQLAALNKEGAAQQREEDTTMKTVIEALGLPEGASEQDVLTAVNKLKSDEASARNRAESPDSAKFVPRADLELAQNKVAALEAREGARQEAAIEAAVDAAIEGGKVAPASRDYHVAACRQEGGLEKFQAMTASAPVMLPDSPLPGKAPGGGGSALTEEQRAACRMTGVSEKDYAATMADQSKE